MQTPQPRNDELDEACRLVGRFLKYYALMEQAINAAIGKLLGLGAGTIDIIGANIPVAKKVDVLFSAEKFLAAVPENHRRTFLRETRSAIMTLNDERVIIAHCPFEPLPGGGIIFRRVVTKGELKVISVTRLSKDIEDQCQRAEMIASDLDRIVTEMRPYTPGLDFSDGRNSMYLGLL